MECAYHGDSGSVIDVIAHAQEHYRDEIVDNNSITSYTNKIGYKSFINMTCFVLGLFNPTGIDACWSWLILLMKTIEDTLPATQFIDLIDSENESIGVPHIKDFHYQAAYAAFDSNGFDFYRTIFIDPVYREHENFASGPAFARTDTRILMLTQIVKGVHWINKKWYHLKRPIVSSQLHRYTNYRHHPMTLQISTRMTPADEMYNEMIRKYIELIMVDYFTPADDQPVTPDMQTDVINSLLNRGFTFFEQHLKPKQLNGRDAFVRISIELLHRYFRCKMKLYSHIVEHLVRCTNGDWYLTPGQYLAPYINELLKHLLETYPLFRRYMSLGPQQSTDETVYDTDGEWIQTHELEQLLRKSIASFYRSQFKDVFDTTLLSYINWNTIAHIITFQPITANDYLIQTKASISYRIELVNILGELFSIASPTTNPLIKSVVREYELEAWYQECLLYCERDIETGQPFNPLILTTSGKKQLPFLLIDYHVRPISLNVNPPVNQLRASIQTLYRLFESKEMIHEIVQHEFMPRRKDSQPSFTRLLRTLVDQMVHMDFPSTRAIRKINTLTQTMNSMEIE
jgi:hypothetical protein